MELPPTIFVAFGVVVASIIAGVFSFLNLVSSKENKVSEFRLEWINGLREEVAILISGIQELVRHQVDDSEEYDLARHMEWLKQTREAYHNVINNLSRIQMRLNPKHIEENPESPEAKLMASIEHVRKLFNDEKYEEAFRSCSNIRKDAAPLLKSTWDLVKNGEPGYRRIRRITQRTLAAGLIFVIAIPVALAFIILANNWFKSLAPLAGTG